MPGLIGKKIGMTSVFSADGKNVPCTVLEAGPCVVTQVKTKENDGYNAVQVAYGEKKEKRTSKPLQGHFKQANTTPKRIIHEFKNFDEEYSVGDVITADKLFSEDIFVDVSGTSKGKGFQGVMKRHGFRGVMGATHGQHDTPRAPGSIGAASDPSRVFKGMRMAGRTGGKKVKLINLQVLKVMPEENLIIVKGAVPGHKGSYITIEK